VLDLPAERHELFAALRDDDATTFARAVRALLPDGEGDYYVLRYGDPTFVVAESVTRTVASRLELPPRTRFVDVCGGCGHLSTTLAGLAADWPGTTPTLLDRSFWRLWLAQRFLAPTADVVCCDANVPLPLATGCASLSVCNDAIHYVWGKRLITSELQRVTSWCGAVVVTHAHSVLGDNATAGNTLTPAGYASLFERHPPVTGRDDELLEWALGRSVARWHTDADECGSADAIALVGMPHAAALPEAPATVGQAPGARWIVNPLLAITSGGGHSRLTIAWPSDHYAWEFSAVRRYIDDEIELPSGALADLDALARERPDLVARRVLLHVPAGYL
jgi:SAM-dependent methyltransferase